MHSNSLQQQQQHQESSNNRQNLLNFDLYPERTRDLYHWITYIVMENQPFTTVESPWLRQFLSLKTVISRQAISSATKVKTTLPPKFGIMFDGWTQNGFHYIATFAVFAENEIRQQMLLNFGSLDDDYTADEYVELFSEIMELYGRSVADIIFLISDNCCCGSIVRTDTLGTG